MKTRFNYFTLSILLISLLTACGTNKKNLDQQQTSESSLEGDITRPPVFIKKGDQNTETSPDQVISAEQWQKQQDQQN